MIVRRFTALVLAGLVAASPVAAQSWIGSGGPPAPSGVKLAATQRGMPVNQLDAAQRATLQRVNAYFNSLTNVTADFEQIGPDGSRSVGKLYLSRPGKIRFQYAPPSPLEIIADGSSVSVRNRKLATQELWPLSQTPLRFLLAEKIDLLKDSNVIGVYQEPEMVSVVLEEKNAIGGAAQLQLMFSGQNYALKQWTVTDAQGMETSVALTDVAQVAKFDPNLFKIVQQRWGATAR